MPSVIINNLFKMGELVKLSNGDLDTKDTTRSSADYPHALNRNILFERKIIQIKCKYQVISQFAKQNYFLQLHEGTGWDIYWTDKQFLSPRILKSMMPYQRINYFPGMAILTNKQNLTHRLNLYRTLFPQDYDFFPTTWVVMKNAATPISTEISSLTSMKTESTRPTTILSTVETISTTSTNTVETESKIESLSTTAIALIAPLPTASESTKYISKATKSLPKATISLSSTAILSPTTSFSKTTYPDDSFNSMQDCDPDVSKTLETRPSCETALRIGLANSNENKTKKNDGTNFVEPLHDMTNLTHVKMAEVQKNYNSKIFNKHEFSIENKWRKEVETNKIIELKPCINGRDEPFLTVNQQTKYEIMERIEKPVTKKIENSSCDVSNKHQTINRVSDEKDIKTESDDKFSEDSTDNFNVNEKLKNIGVRINTVMPPPNLKHIKSTKNKFPTVISAVNKMQQHQILLRDNVKTMIMALNRVQENVTVDKCIVEGNTNTTPHMYGHKSTMSSYGRTFDHSRLSEKENSSTNEIQQQIEQTINTSSSLSKNIVNTSEQSNKETIDNVDIQTELDDKNCEVSNENVVNTSELYVTKVGKGKVNTVDKEMELYDTRSDVSNKNETKSKATKLSEETINIVSDEKDMETESDDKCSEVSDEKNIEIESEDKRSEISNEKDVKTESDEKSSEVSDGKDIETESDDSEFSDEKDIGTESDEKSSKVSDEKDITETESDDEVGDEKDIETESDISEVKDEKSIETEHNDSEVSDEYIDKETESHVTTPALAVESNSIYILKPCDGCQGKGIKLAMNIDQVVESMEFDSMICQQYITNPLLWNGYKFDIRFYVLITSVKQLRIYIYNEGIVRLATEKYEHPSESNIDNMCMHLTNYSINKNSENFSEDQSKQSLARMNTFLLEQGVELNALYGKIHDMIVKTILTGYKSILREYLETFKTHVYREACFQLLGFDILLDNLFNPYLLEINKNASLKRPTPIDKEIKTKLTKDLFSILNLNENRLRGDILWDNLSYTTYRKRYVEHEASNRGDFSLIYPCAGKEQYNQYISDEINA